MSRFILLFLLLVLSGCSYSDEATAEKPPLPKDRCSFYLEKSVDPRYYQYEKDEWAEKYYDCKEKQRVRYEKEGQ